MTLSTFKKLFEEFQESGLKVRNFCANQSFAPSSFQELLQQRDEMFQELLRLRKIDNGALDTLEPKNQELEVVVADCGLQTFQHTEKPKWAATL